MNGVILSGVLLFFFLIRNLRDLILEEVDEQDSSMQEIKTKMKRKTRQRRKRKDEKGEQQDEKNGDQSSEDKIKKRGKDNNGTKGHKKERTGTERLHELLKAHEQNILHTLLI